MIKGYNAIRLNKYNLYKVISMSNLTKKTKFLFSVLPLVAVLFLSSCSNDDNVEATTDTATVEKSIVGNGKNMTTNKLDKKSHYKEMSKSADKANWVEKGKFNKEFKKDCIARELNSAGADKKVDKQFIEKTCDCIADYMDDHLTDQEADEFLKEDSHMRALQIRYDTAAYQCIEGAKKVSKPKITRFQ